MARMLTRGTEALGAEEIQHLLDACAGSMGAAAGRNSVSLRAEFLSRHLDRAFSLFADCLRAPAFPEEELERERHLLLQEIAARDDRPSSLAFDGFTRTLFHHHPYRLPQQGERATVESLSRAALVDHHRRFLDPSQLVLAIIGDVDTAEVLALARARFGDAIGTRRAGPDHPPRATAHRAASLPPAAGPGTDPPGPRLPGPDRGRSRSPRAGGALHRALRDGRAALHRAPRQAEHGLLRHLHGGGGRRPGLLRHVHRHQPGQEGRRRGGDGGRAAAAGGHPGDAGGAGPRPASTWSARTRSGCSATRPRATLLALDTAYGLGLDNFEHYDERVQAVTAADVQRVAARVLRLEHSALAVVGP